MDAEEQEREPDGPRNGSAGQAPNATCPHDNGKEVNEQNEQGHDHQQRPLKGLQLVVGGESKVKGKQHASEPGQHQTPNQEHDEADDEAEFDALLHLGRLERNERHHTTQAQTQHERDEESGHACSAFTGQPVAQRELVRNEQLDGIEEDGVVNRADDIG